MSTMNESPDQSTPSSPHDADRPPIRTGLLSLITDPPTGHEEKGEQYTHLLEKTLTQLSSMLEMAPVSIYVTAADGRLRLANQQWQKDTGIDRTSAIGGKLTELFPPELAHKYHENNRQALEQGTLELEEWVNTPQGERCYRTLKFPVQEIDGTTSAVGGISVDVTEYKRLEAELHERATLAEFQAAVGSVLIRRGALPDLLQAAAQAIIEVLDAAYVCLWTLDEAGAIPERQASVGRPTKQESKSAAIGPAEIGRVNERRQPLIYNNLSREPFIDNSEWLDQEGIVTFAGYPLMVDEQIVGTMAIFCRQPLTDQHLQTMVASANSIALAIERKRAETKLTQQIDELRRWYKATLGREMRILDLKQEVNQLLAQAGQPPRYASAQSAGNQ
jgi:PAS domain S-box-containing protein